MQRSQPVDGMILLPVEWICGSFGFVTTIIRGSLILKLLFENKEDELEGNIRRNVRRMKGFGEETEMEVQHQRATLIHTSSRIVLDIIRFPQHSRSEGICTFLLFFFYFHSIFNWPRPAENERRLLPICISSTPKVLFTSLP